MPEDADILYSGAFRVEGLDDKIRSIEDLVKRRCAPGATVQRSISAGEGYPLYIWWWVAG